MFISVSLQRLVHCKDYKHHDGLKDKQKQPLQIFDGGPALEIKLTNRFLNQTSQGQSITDDP